MERKVKKISKHVLAVVQRIIILLMIKEGKIDSLNRLRGEPLIGEIINIKLKELAELGLIKVTSNKTKPFELTAKGDAAADISLFNGHAFYLRINEIKQVFDNWKEQMREKQKGGKDEEKTKK
ncbi:MAG: hypothetical protein CO001_02645 [Candidatus Portnoybacteria bacterium CG_4_8_14_3_um_filter_40_10]|uniref:HTH hxlR-type domain-containing protein n=4 Tax=Candidatus Portnoyibacteriota TaxID=1817913 RepID=A0A2M7II55_9BACT|nr:MAG: hypothetical protein COV84_01465 [Candidatus Portnoybacteria bacterium CG11_big_fil_rev_8_21_14_0_20_40_15]PIS31977.1 MAG: hypothetical protein COT41_00125 [Candidatus Portnoybacteria bacterium CG08_land_8_20_14_0_20_40_83]PIW76216.1 MAG: hypothetical protein CO001_02645 [Candidatus Portnoybacteria bacterium CG_4_8_14_3_um_filter_40_10]PIY74301.1 MAG: hypothetical protein COY85_03660 [Candidatus Portnoybacteria bacterium CG_4_10_14_0_8_um_filter_40_50]PJA64530.1 MAG: hypothetical protei